MRDSFSIRRVRPRWVNMENHLIWVRIIVLQANQSISHCSAQAHWRTLLPWRRLGPCAHQVAGLLFSSHVTGSHIYHARPSHNRFAHSSAIFFLPPSPLHARIYEDVSLPSRLGSHSILVWEYLFVCAVVDDCESDWVNFKLHRCTTLASANPQHSAVT